MKRFCIITVSSHHGLKIFDAKKENYGKTGNIFYPQKFEGAHFEKANDRFLQQYSGQKLFGNNIAVDL